MQDEEQISRQNSLKSVLEEQHLLLSTKIEKMDALPASIGDHIRHNLKNNSVVQVTVNDVTRIVN